MPFDGSPPVLDLPLGGLRPPTHKAPAPEAPAPAAGWLGLPDLSDADWLHPTPDLPRRLRRGSGPVVLGAETDPYAPTGRGLALTRQVLEALEDAGRPVTILTSATAVLRDRDILSRLAGRGLVRVCIALATLDPVLARRLEPRAAAPAMRLAAIHALAAAGIPVAVLAAPLVAGLNDLELDRILAAAAAAGAAEAGCALLSLPPEARPAFEAWVRAQMPGRAAQVLALAREVLAAGHPPGRPAGTLAERFHAAVARHGLNRPQAEVRHRHTEAALAAA